MPNIAMADLPPPSYEGAVGNSSPDPRVEAGVLILHLGGPIIQDPDFGDLRRFFRLHLVHLDTEEAEDIDRLKAIHEKIVNVNEVSAELIVMTELTKMGYRIIDKLRGTVQPYNITSRISFIRDPLWKA
jgi:hypothetical protein